MGLGVRSGGWFESSWAETSREWTCKLRQLISQTTLRTPRINDHPWFRAVVSYRRSCQSKPTQTIKLSTVLIDPDFICSVEERDPYRPLQVRSTIDEYRGAAGARRQTTLLWPCRSRLAAVCWDQHTGSMQSVARMARCIASALPAR